MKIKVGDKVRSVWDRTCVGVVEKITPKGIWVRWNVKRTGEPRKKLNKWGPDEAKYLEVL